MSFPVNSGSISMTLSPHFVISAFLNQEWFRGEQS
jgi:hypothetical protein